MWGTVFEKPKNGFKARKNGSITKHAKNAQKQSNNCSKTTIMSMNHHLF